MGHNHEKLLTGEMLLKYYELNKKKKEIEVEINQLKDTFHQYLDHFIGANLKGEITISGFKLQRQIRNIEKYDEEVTIQRLEELHMNDLIQIVKKPDEVKIKSALHLGFLNENHLEGCIIKTSSPAITVKPITPR
jgi:hypothetical protein